MLTLIAAVGHSTLPPGKPAKPHSLTDSPTGHITCITRVTFTCCYAPNMSIMQSYSKFRYRVFRPGSVYSGASSAMSTSQLLAAKPAVAHRNGRRSSFQGASPCSARLLVLIDVGHLAQTHSEQKGANVDAAAGAHQAQSPRSSPAAASTAFVDGLRLSVLRVLSQLSLSCPPDSCVEWAARFFDSRHSGVGKTPSELKARLRSRQAAQGTRGFTRLSQASFQTFGDACLAVACGVQGDPLARDRQAALRRWSHGRKKQQQPQTW